MYGIETSSITVHSMIALSPEADAPSRIDRYASTFSKLTSEEDTETWSVDWKYENAKLKDGNFICEEAEYYDEETVRKFSKLFIQAIHVSNTAYSAHMAAFSMTFEEACGKLFKSNPPAKYGVAIEKSDLVLRFTNEEWGFENITIGLMASNGIEAVALFPPKNIFNDKYPQIAAEYLGAFRIYVSYVLRRVMIIPHITLGTTFVKG